jgi:flagellin-like protein
MNLKQLFSTDDDRGVSPVIGVILMVAITVILAAVIASFVLGLGGNNDPAPSPTIDSSVDAGENNITLDVTGGDDFDATVATIQGEIDGNSFEENLDASGADEITAGDTIVLNSSSSSTGAGPVIELNGDDLGTSISDSSVSNGWEVEIIWNPSDQDSTTIYSDSSE